LLRAAAPQGSWRAGRGVSLIKPPSEFAQSEGAAHSSRPQFYDQATLGARVIAKMRSASLSIC